MCAVIFAAAGSAPINAMQIFQEFRASPEESLAHSEISGGFRASFGALGRTGKMMMTSVTRYNEEQRKKMVATTQAGR
jgi:hypothetical protein